MRVLRTAPGRERANVCAVSVCGELTLRSHRVACVLRVRHALCTVRVRGQNLCGLCLRGARATISSSSVRVVTTPNNVRASYSSCA